MKVASWATRTTDSLRPVGLCEAQTIALLAGYRRTIFFPIVAFLESRRGTVEERLRAMTDFDIATALLSLTVFAAILLPVVCWSVWRGATARRRGKLKRDESRTYSGSER